MKEKLKRRVKNLEGKTTKKSLIVVIGDRLLGDDERRQLKDSCHSLVVFSEDDVGLL
jgi:hypothetical protein